MKPLALAVSLLASQSFAQTSETSVESVPSLSDIKVKKHQAAPKDAQAAKAAAGLSNDCFLQEGDFNYQLKRKADGGWTYFLTKKGGNAFQLCINQRQSIFVQGIPVFGQARVDGENLLIEAAYAKRMVPAEDVAAGAVSGAQFTVPGGPTYELTSRYTHYIDAAAAAPDAVTAGGNSGTVYADKLAWLTLGVDPRVTTAKVAQVRLVGADPDVAERRLRRAFALPAVSGSAFGDKASIETIVAHVRKQLARFPGAPLVRNPAVFIELWLKKDGLAGEEPIVAVSLVVAGRKAGVDPRGEDIIDSESYDDLLYCYDTKKLEPRSAHNAHLAAKKKP